MAARSPRLRLRLLTAGLLAAAGALAVLALTGVALLGLGIAGWLHPVDVPGAWTRTLAGVGLIGAGGGGGSLCLLALAGALRRSGAAGAGAARLLAITAEPAGMGRALKFGAVIGLAGALICLPLALGMRAGFGRPWFGF